MRYGKTVPYKQAKKQITVFVTYDFSQIQPSDGRTNIRALVINFPFNPFVTNPKNENNNFPQSIPDLKQNLNIPAIFLHYFSLHHNHGTVKCNLTHDWPPFYQITRSNANHIFDGMRDNKQCVLNAITLMSKYCSVCYRYY